METTSDSIVSLSKWMAVLLFVALESSVAWADHKSGYPEQERFSTDPPVERPDLTTHISPAQPELVNSLGSEFSSLHGLGVLLVLATNRTHETPVSIARESVRLKLPDGLTIKPLDPPEILKWLEEVYGPEVKKPFGPDEKMGFENGRFQIPRGRPVGRLLIFRFPQGTKSGYFDVEYALDLGEGDPLLVKQKPRLNLAP